MATKPTERILDWASAGSTTDPGAGKEAAGWVTSERPPANWWNWILSSFGKWLTWSETSIDDLETDFAALKLVAPISVIQVTTDDTTGVPTVSTKVGVTPAGTHSQETNGQGDSGGEVHIDYGAALSSVAAVQITPIWDTTADANQKRWPLFTGVTGTQIEFIAVTAAGGFVNFDTANPQDFVITVWGAV